MVYSRNTSSHAYIKAVTLCALALSTLLFTMADTCTVSDSDKMFGIRVVDDIGCTNGGLGCYNDHCRYCKVRDNPRTTQFESCSSFGVNFPSVTALTLTTGPCEVSAGDATAGIAAVADTDCLYGGLGCFGDHCRFCKVKETPESTAFMSCSGLNVSTLVTKPTTTTSVTIATTPTPTVVGTAPCTLQVSDGDASAGINIVSDASCSLGGVGCIDNVCRFCRVMTTVASAAFSECSKITGVTVVADAPTVSSTPAEAAEVFTTRSAAAGASCNLVAAESDIKAGISIVSDTSCATGGIGCLTSECRYCRLVYTMRSVALTECGKIGSTTTNTKEALLIADANSAAAIKAPVRASDTSGCTQVVSSDDAAVGINIVTDTACSTGGLGCIDAVCRFCKTVDTEQSSRFLICTSIGGYTFSSAVASNVSTAVTTVAPITSEALTPIETPTATLSSLASGEACTQIVSEGDALIGIKITTDTSCANDGTG